MLASDDRYTLKSVALLSARARRAFLDYMPANRHQANLERIHRIVHYGPSLDVFVIDMRSFRGPNGDGPPLGRELEMAQRWAIKANGVKNVVWLTADVHYTAAHYYDPNQAQFQDFDPFWEFLSSPLNAGAFGPNELDDTFGPQVKFQRAPAEGQINLPPSAGMQFYGQVEIDGDTEMMTVTLHDLEGAELFRQALEPSA